MTLMRVTAVDYTTIGEDEEAEPVVKVCGRDEHGERRVHHVYGTRPYLYVREGDQVPDGHHGRVVKEERGFESYDGIPLQRWTCRVPDDVKAMKKQFEETWESDIPFYRRCSIDYDLSGYVDMPDSREVHIDDVETDPEYSAGDAIEPRIVYGDIEVKVGEESFEEMLENAEREVTAITLYDTHEDRYDAYLLDPPDSDYDPHDVKETLERNGFDTDEEQVVIHASETEKALLHSFLGYFEDRRPDMTTGWNWVGFDVLYLLRRIKRLHDPDEEEYDLDLNRLSDAGGTKRNFSDYHGDLARTVIGVPAIDLMKLFFERMEFTQWRSHSLEYVSQQVVGRGKVADTGARGWEDQRAEFLAYNIVDVELCVRIDEQRDIVDTCMGLAEESQVQIYDVFSEMRLVDGYIMSRSDTDEILPEQKESDIPENAGGLVLEPADGVSEWVGVMDLKSLYPSSMITWNISPETVQWTEEDDEPDLRVPWVPEADDVTYPVTEDQISWDKLGTSLEEEGIVPRYLKLLFVNREDAKWQRNQYEPGSPEYETWDRKQYGIKVLMNSFYGVSSNDYWRLATHGLGDAITSASRYALFKGKQIVERNGYEVIYGDTDSCFFGLEREDPPDMEDEYKRKAVLDGKGLVSMVNDGMEEAIRDSGLEGDHPFLDDSLRHATDSHCLKYEFEKLYRRYIQFGKKKRYAGLIVWKEGKDVDDIDISGFEAKRSDTPELAAEAQTEVLHKVLGGVGFDGVSEYVSGLCDDIRNEDVQLAAIARPKSLGKALDDYDTTTQTVKACRASEDQLEKSWVKNDDPFLVFLDETPPMTPSVSVIALDWNDELPSGYSIDAAEHTRICLEAPLEPVLDELGWTWKEVKNGTQAGDASESDWGAAADPGGSESSDRLRSTESSSGSNSGTEGRDDDKKNDELGSDGDRDDEDEAAGSSGNALEADW